MREASYWWVWYAPQGGEAEDPRSFYRVIAASMEEAADEWCALYLDSEPIEAGACTYLKILRCAPDACELPPEEVRKAAPCYLVHLTYRVVVHSIVPMLRLMSAAKDETA